MIHYAKGHPSPISSETIINTKESPFAYFFRRSLHKKKTLQNNNGFNLIGATLPLPISSTIQYSLWGKGVIKAFQAIFSKGVFLFSYYLFISESLGEKEGQRDGKKKKEKSLILRKLLKMMSWNQIVLWYKKSSEEKIHFMQRT